MDFREIYDEHAAFVFRALDRLGVAQRSLPDAVQEVFTVAFRARDRFEGRSSIRTWLFGIARRVASDARRSAPARREVLGDALVDVVDGNDTAWAEQAEALARARVLLDSLPEEQRLVFALFEVEGWTGAEIAEATGVSVSTVHTRLRLAREGIKRRLAEIGPEALMPLLRVGPNPEMHERTWGRIATTLPRSLATAATVKVSVVLGLFAVSVGATFFSSRHPAAPPRPSLPPITVDTIPAATVTSEPDVVEAPPLEALEPRPTKGPVPPRRSIPSASSPPAPAPPPPKADGLREEAEGLRKARQHLRSHDARAALAELDRLAVRFPAGALEEEREVLAIEALVVADPPAGHRRAERFIRERPQSVHAGRIRVLAAPR